MTKSESIAKHWEHATGYGDRARIAIEDGDFRLAVKQLRLLRETSEEMERILCDIINEANK